MKKSQLRKIIQEEIKNLKEGFFSSPKQPLTRDDYFRLKGKDTDAKGESWIEKKTLKIPSDEVTRQEQMMGLYVDIEDKIGYIISDFRNLLRRYYKENPEFNLGDDTMKINNEVLDLIYDKGEVTAGEILDRILPYFVK